jgi:hypothetical protein
MSSRGELRLDHEPNQRSRRGNAKATLSAGNLHGLSRRASRCDDDNAHGAELRLLRPPHRLLAPHSAGRSRTQRFGPSAQGRRAHFGAQEKDAELPSTNPC